MAEPNTSGQSGSGDQNTADTSQQLSDPAADAAKAAADAAAQSMVSRDELNKVVGERQAAKEARRAAEEANAKLLEQVKGMPSADDLELLTQIKAERADAARKAALKEGDADAIAAAARKPVEAERDELRQDNVRLTAQLTTLLRDQKLDSAIRQSELAPIAPDVVRDALRQRVQMERSNGEYVAAFTSGDGQPLYNPAGKVTEMQEFVDIYLREHPNLCKAKTTPGSGARPQGGSTHAEGKPHTLTEFNALADDKRMEVAMNMSPEERDAMLGVERAGVGAFL